MTSGTAKRWPAWLLLLAACPVWAAGWGVETLMADLAKAPGYRATFQETKHLSVLDQPLVLKGTLLYEPPDHLKKVVTAPHEKIYDIRGETLTVASPQEGSRQVAVDSHPLLQTLVATLRGVLSGDLQALRQHYRLNLEGQPGRWQLRLEPSGGQIAERLRFVLVRGREDRVQSVKTVEANGDFSLLEVKRDHGR